MHVTMKNLWATRIPLLTRSYASAVPKVVKESPPPDPSRIFTDRKAHLHAQYAHILSTSPAILILQHGNFSSAALSKLRRELSQITVKSLTLTSPTPQPTLPPPAFKVIRPGVFSASLRTRFNAKTTASIRTILEGPIAVLTFPTLNPPQLARAVRLIDRAVAPISAPPAPRKAVAADDIEDAPPRVKPPPTISLLGAIIEERLFLVDGVKEIGKLPSLETLHAQIVGLLSAPGMTLARVLSQAGGGDVLRVLQGFEKGLEMEQSGPPKSEP